MHGEHANAQFLRLAHRRAATHVPVVAELLRCRLRDPESLPDDASDDYRRVIDHLVSATQLRHPVVGDLARRSFDLASDASGWQTSAPRFWS